MSVVMTVATGSGSTIRTHACRKLHPDKTCLHMCTVVVLSLPSSTIVKVHCQVVAASALASALGTRNTWTPAANMPVLLKQKVS
jgi:hypothetical protein